MTVVTLDITGDTILNGSEELGHFHLSRTGCLSLEHDKLKDILGRFAKALNAQHDHLRRMQEDSESVQGLLQAMQSQSAESEQRFVNNEVKLRELGTQVDALAHREDKAQSQMHTDSIAQDLKTIQNDAIKQVQQQAQMLERLEALDKSREEETRRFEEMIGTCREAVRRQQDIIDVDLEQRFAQTEEAVLGLKVDQEALHNSLEEISAEKATRVETLDLQRNLEAIAEEQEREKATLKDAQQNLAKLDTCIDLAEENRSRVEEVWKIVRDELGQLRGWVSGQVGELRSTVRGKMEENRALSLIDELRHQAYHTNSFLKEETIQRRRQQEVVHEVQRILSRSPEGGGAGPMQLAEVDDKSEASAAGRKMIPSAGRSRPGTSGVCIGGGGSPPRIPPPLVHVPPRQAGISFRGATPRKTPLKAVLGGNIQRIQPKADKEVAPTLPPPMQRYERYTSPEPDDPTSESSFTMQPGATASDY